MFSCLLAALAYSLEMDWNYRILGQSTLAKPEEDSAL